MFLICHCDFVELSSSSPSDLTAEWNYEIGFCYDSLRRNATIA